MRALIFIVVNRFFMYQFEVNFNDDALKAIAVATLIFFVMDIAELCSKFVEKAGDGK